MLGAELKGQAEREFEAFSWMLIEGTRYPPLVHEDRIWILQVPLICRSGGYGTHGMGSERF